MKKRFILPLTAVVLALTLITGAFGAAAQDTVKSPTLSSIAFKNASLDERFSPNVFEYGLTLEDNTKSPTLESYEIDGRADIFISYRYDATNHPIGVTATLQYDNGSTIYNFTYSNPAEYVKSSNNLLSDIVCTYGEILPAVNDEDTAYKLYIPSDLTQVTITPVTQDINAYCAPVELVLDEGQEPKITLYSTASDGSKREYLLTIKRVDKTLSEVKAELDSGKQSFVQGTLLHQRPEFVIFVCAAVGGILLVALLFVLTRRIAVVPYDKDEQPFYRE